MTEFIKFCNDFVPVFLTTKDKIIILTYYTIILKCEISNNAQVKKKSILQFCRKFDVHVQFLPSVKLSVTQAIRLYRFQRIAGKGMFSVVCVCPRVGGVPILWDRVSLLPIPPSPDGPARRDPPSLEGPEKKELNPRRPLPCPAPSPHPASVPIHYVIGMGDMGNWPLTV